MKSSIKGFPELTVSERFYERQVINKLSQTFELNAFSNIETASVENVSRLLQKGETSKEIYVLKRLQDQTDQTTNKIGLHFDLTVPLARYVGEFLNDLVFPFKRYQIQKVWRGERPQAGRFREFTQADIDIVGRNDLPSILELDLARTYAQAITQLQTIGLPKTIIRINHRELMNQIFISLNLDSEIVPHILNLIDKYHKLEAEVFQKSLSDLGLNKKTVNKVFEICAIQTTSKDELINKLANVVTITDIMSSIILEMAHFIHEVQLYTENACLFDLSIARGLDYYSGIVIETIIENNENFGSICSGGRYDSLIKVGKNHFPGIGLSFGVTRLLQFLFDKQIIEPQQISPARVFITVNSEKSRFLSNQIADTLRQRNIPAEVSFTADKLGNQIKLADRQNIPFVWFIDENNQHSVKNLKTGEQIFADPASWSPEIQTT
jgi:histidyl-tRNA synthetase